MPFPKSNEFSTSDDKVLSAWNDAFTDYSVYKSAQKKEELIGIRTKLIGKLNEKNITSDELFLLALCERYLETREKALRYFDMAIRQGNAEAMYTRARHHEEGIVNPENPEAARYLYKLASDKGHVKAQAALKILQNEEIWLNTQLTHIVEFYSSILPQLSKLKITELPALSDQMSLKDLMKFTRILRDKFQGISLANYKNIIIENIFKDIDHINSLMHRFLKPILSAPGTDNLLLNEYLADDSDGQSAIVLEALDRFQFEINISINSGKIQSSDRRASVASIQNFYTHAKLLCNQTPKQGTQEEYNQLVGAKLLKLAKKDFQHRHKVLRVLADIVFIPLGILTFGATFFIKEAVTGSKTFFVDKKTSREEKLIEQVDKELISKGNKAPKL